MTALVALLDGKGAGDGSGSSGVAPVEPEAPPAPASGGKKVPEDDTIVTPQDGAPVAWSIIKHKGIWVTYIHTHFPILG